MQDKFLIHRAIEFAVLKHKDQKRKGTDIPYIVHPIEVMHILDRENCPDEIVAAGILHDTVEDTDATIDEIRDLFGDEIARVVSSESEDKSKSWEERKGATIERLKICDRATAICTLADKLSNATSIAYDREKCGNAVWERFNRPYAQVKWYYTEIKKATERLADTKIWQDYAKICEHLFGA